MEKAQVSWQWGGVLTEHLLCALFWVGDAGSQTQLLPSGTVFYLGKTHKTRLRW